MESLTGIHLKTLPRWLIHKDRLRERQESGNNRGSAIVIIIVNASDAAYLCTKGLRFGGVLKLFEKYWEAGPGSVYLICCGIGQTAQEVVDKSLQNALYVQELISLKNTSVELVDAK